MFNKHIQKLSFPMANRDKSSFQIFSNLFVKKKVTLLDHVQVLFRDKDAWFYLSLTFCVSALLFSFFISLRTSDSLFGIWDNSFAGNKQSELARSTYEQNTPTITELRENMQKSAITYGELKSNGDVADYPIISASRSIIKEQVDWTRALTGLDDAIKDVLATNDILKRIILGSVTLAYDTKHISLENMRIYGTKDSHDTGTGISVAAKLLDALEASPVFKNVTSSTLEQKVDVSTGGTSSEVFTPLNVSMFYQDPNDSNEKDTTGSITPEIKSLQPTIK